MAEHTVTSDLLALTIDVVSSYVGQNNIRADDVPAFIASVHESIKGLSGPEAPADADAPQEEEFTPAVTARKSLSSPDHIISMIDGKPYKTLRRHLATHGLTPDQYRARYKLKPDYPMVAPSYSETRKALAEKIGLGRKPAAAAEPAPAPKKEAKSRGGTKGGLAALKGVRERNAKQADAKPPVDDEQQQQD